MRRFASLLVAAVAVVGAVGSSGAAAGDDHGLLNCGEGRFVCAETADAIGYEGRYTGHDEPSLLFYSSTAGSGNSNLYRLQLPSDPKKQPTQDGKGTTWNFQLRPAIWLGMALCDNQSGPEFTHAPCTPDSDTNILDGTDRRRPTTSASIRERRSSSSSSIRPGGLRGRPASAAMRRSGVSQWRSSASTRT